MSDRERVAWDSLAGSGGVVLLRCGVCDELAYDPRENGGCNACGFTGTCATCGSYIAAEDANPDWPTADTDACRKVQQDELAGEASYDMGRGK